MLDKRTGSWINLHVIIKLFIWLWLCYLRDMIWPGWLHRSGSWKCEQDLVQTVCWWRSEASSGSQGFRALRPPLHPTLHLQQWAQRGPLLGVADLHPIATHCQSQEERINHQWTQTLDVFTKGGKRKLKKKMCCSICCLLAQNLHLVMSSGIGPQSNLFQSTLVGIIWFDSPVKSCFRLCVPLHHSIHLLRPGPAWRQWD